MPRVIEGHEHQAVLDFHRRIYREAKLERWRKQVERMKFPPELAALMLACPPF